jgi:hypothetical protein
LVSKAFFLVFIFPSEKFGQKLINEMFKSWSQKLSLNFETFILLWFFRHFKIRLNCFLPENLLRVFLMEPYRYFLSVPLKQRASLQMAPEGILHFPFSCQPVDP